MLTASCVVQRISIMQPTLGQRLKHAREKMGLSLADVAHQTRIPMPRLKDLEDDNYNALGGMAYARSFLQTYAQLVEVNADPVLEQMQTPPLGGTRDFRYLMENFGSWVGNRAEFSAPPAKSMSQPRSFAPVLAIAGLVLLIGMGVLLGQAWIGDRKNNVSASARSASPAVPAKVGISTTEKPLSTYEISRPAIIPDSIRPKESVSGVSKNNGAPPKALPVEDDLPKAKR